MASTKLPTRAIAALRKFGEIRTMTTASGHTAVAIAGEPGLWLVKTHNMRWTIIQLMERGIRGIEAIDLNDGPSTSTWIPFAMADRKSTRDGAPVSGWYIKVEDRDVAEPHSTLTDALTTLLTQAAARRAELRQSWSRDAAHDIAVGAMRWEEIDGDTSTPEGQCKERAARAATAYMVKCGTFGWTATTKPPADDYSWNAWYTIALMHFGDLAQKAGIPTA